MAGRQGMGFIHTSFVRAQHFGIRFSHGLRRLEPLGGEPPGVVITGASGTIGRVLREDLADSYALRTIDQLPRPGIDLVADVRKSDRMATAFAGAAAVIELAASPGVGAGWVRVMENNLAATIGTLDAARRAGVARVVIASSNHVTGMYERDEPYVSVLAGRYEGLDPEALPRIRADGPIRPDSLYGVGKCATEAAGRFYAEEHGLSVICLRIGTVNRLDRPRSARDFATLLTYRDLTQLVRRCLEAPPELGFGVFYGVSRNTWRIWDIDDAAAALGYDPVDDAESFR